MKSYDAVTTKYSHVFDQHDTVCYELLRILIDKEVKSKPKNTYIRLIQRVVRVIS